MFIPVAGEPLTVSLPNEITRATVVRVLNKDTIEADLNLSYPLTRVHGFAFGDRLRFRRAKDVLGERWEVAEKAPKERPAVVGPPPRVAADDEHDPLPERPVPPQKAKRRSDAEAEKPKARKNG